MALRGSGARLARALLQSAERQVAGRGASPWRSAPPCASSSSACFAARGLISSDRWESSSAAAIPSSATPLLLDWTSAIVAGADGVGVGGATTTHLPRQRRRPPHSQEQQPTSASSLELVDLIHRRSGSLLSGGGGNSGASGFSIGQHHWQQQQQEHGRHHRHHRHLRHHRHHSLHTSSSAWFPQQQQDQQQPPKQQPLPTTPSADECDSALATYDAAREQQQQRSAARRAAAAAAASSSAAVEGAAPGDGRRRVPSTYKTTSQRLLELVRATLSGLIAGGRWLACAPKKAAALARWSRADWSAWWGRTKKVVREEAHHYWLGTKLLAVEVRIASGLAFKAARGEALTRRERRQLTRTTADVFRLVPLLVVVLIPFMELALPLLLKIFPNMLPSTFEDKLRKEEEIKRRVQVKIEVARFLQDTVAQMASEIKSRRSGSAAAASADELYRFMGRVRSGEPVDNSELIRFAALFSDELTLENLDRVQVVSLCQLLGLPPYGTDGFLRSRLRGQLAKIKRDDAVISAEGLEKLEDDELRAALRARGMRGVYGEGANAYMRGQLRGWLDLSLNHGLPSSLLLLSRAFTLTGVEQPPVLPPAAAGAAPPTPVLRAEAAALSGVRETLLTLPETVVQTAGLEAEVAAGVIVPSSGSGGEGSSGTKASEAAAAAAESSGAAAAVGAAASGSAAGAKEAGAAMAGEALEAAAASDSVASRSEALEKKLELVKKEQELIRKEREAMQAEEKAKAASAAAPPDGGKAAGALELKLEAERGGGSSAPAASSAREAAAAAAAQAVLSEAAAGLALKGVDAAEGATGATAEERAAAAAAAREARMRDILSALTVLASSSGVARERQQFMELVRRELDRLAESVPESPSLIFTGAGLQSVRPEDQEEEEEEEEEEGAEAEAAAAAPASDGSGAAGADGTGADASPTNKKIKSKRKADRGDLALSRALEERVSGILHRIEKELDEADRAIGGSMHVIDADGDGLISRDELQQALRFLKGSLDPEDLDALLEQLRVTTGEAAAAGGGGGGEAGGAGAEAAAKAAAPSPSSADSHIPVAELRRLAESPTGEELSKVAAAAAEKAAKQRQQQQRPGPEVEKIHTL
jgi:LETM1 and EF-hand domain-containing protein 1, mitochondrial